MLTPYTFGYLYPEIIRKFREVLIDRLALKPLQPWKSFFMKRDPRRTRSFANISEIFTAFCAELPSLSWMIITYFPSVEESAREFWTANLLFAVHGGGCGSLVFMQKGAIFLEVQTWDCLAYMWQLCQICSLYQVIHRVPSLHWSRTPIIIEATVIRAMSQLVKAYWHL
jgi:hypothetical protein